MGEYVPLFPQELGDKLVPLAVPVGVIWKVEQLAGRRGAAHGNCEVDQRDVLLRAELREPRGKVPRLPTPAGAQRRPGAIVPVDPKFHGDKEDNQLGPLLLTRFLAVAKRFLRLLEPLLFVVAESERRVFLVEVQFAELSLLVPKPAEGRHA